MAGFLETAKQLSFGNYAARYQPRTQATMYMENIKLLLWFLIFSAILMFCSYICLLYKLLLICVAWVRRGLSFNLLVMHLLVHFCALGNQGKV